MGFLPEALRNYLNRLGWGHGDDEVFSSEQAKEWFTLEAIGKGPARFDLQKLENLNGLYIRAAENDYLAEKTLPFLEQGLGGNLSSEEQKTLTRAMPGLKERAKTLKALGESAEFYFKKRPLEMNEKAEKLLDAEARAIISRLCPLLENQEDWGEEALLAAVKEFAENEDTKLGKVAQPLRAALTGSNISPSVFEVMAVLGQAESLNRLRDQGS